MSSTVVHIEHIVMLYSDHGRI